MLTKLKLYARLGASSDIPLRLATGTLRFAAITAMTKSAPLRVTAVAHGLLDQWHVAVVDAKGMTELNAEDSNKIRSSEFHRVTKVDTDNVDFDGISSLNFTAYKSGGALAFYEPMDLSGYTSARMDLKKVVDGDVELTANTANGLLTLDSATSTLWIHLTEADLATLEARDYVFDIELISPSAIDAICAADSVFTILPEVTTST